MKREEQILKRLTEQEGGLFYDTALRAMREFAKKDLLPPAEGAEQEKILTDFAEKMNTAMVNNDPEFEQIVNDHYFDLIEQPTAEGAEKIAHDLDELIERLVPINAANFEFCVKQNIVNGGLLQGIRNVATLHAQKIADKMVSERWINVKDGLPMKDGKSSIYCLVNSEYDGIVVRPYNEYHKCWDTEDADDYYCDAVGGKITHWMPLPNPPIK